MNDENSFLYDPESLLKITLNGQLSLSMLMEEIYLTVSVVFLQGNTDGFTIKCNRSDIPTIERLTKEWEEYTQLEMEFAEYSKMVIRDVNNYLAVYDNSKVKYKGAFEIDRAWHKNHSMRIVPLALSEYYIKNKPVIDTINDHLLGRDYSTGNPDKPIKNYGILDFCKRGRVTGKNKLVARRNGINNPLQKNNRYYVAKKGVDLIKVMPALKNDDGTYKADKLEKYRKQNPNQLDMFHFIDDVLIEKDRETNLEVGYKCELFNTIKDVEFHSNNINKDYYIRECYKIIDIIGN